jgi:hypothetical protein
VSPDIEKAKASTPPEGFIPNSKLKLLDQVSENLNQIPSFCPHFSAFKTNRPDFAPMILPHH